MPVTVDLPEVPPTATLFCAALSNWARSCGARDPLEPEFGGADNVGDGRLDRRRGDQGHAVGKAAAILRMERDAEAAEIIELGRQPPGVERAVGPGDPGTPRAQDRGERQHAAAADAAEKVSGGIAHRRCPMDMRAGLQLGPRIR